MAAALRHVDKHGGRMEITTKLRALIAITMTGLLLLTMATALAMKAPPAKRSAIDHAPAAWMKSAR